MERISEENEEMERDSFSTFPHFLFISSLSIHFFQHVIRAGWPKHVMQKIKLEIWGFVLPKRSEKINKASWFLKGKYPFTDIFLKFLGMLYTLIYLLEKIVWHDTSLNFVHTMKSPRTACSPACRGTPAFVSNASFVFLFLLGIYIGIFIYKW